MGIQNLSGQTLGQYEVRERLGMGGMGAVYRGYQSALKRAVAIKVLPWNLAEQEDYIMRFTREAEIAAALEHPNIVPIYDYGTENGISYVIMRLLTGGSLGQRLTLRDEEDQPLPSPGEAAKLLAQIASALDYAHSQGVIHRDIKPSNIMFDNHGTAYLADFGIAKLMHQNSGLTGGSVLVGTPSFMAPEQWRSEELNGAADQYSAAAVIYAVITGHLPFDANTPYGLMHKHLNEMPTPPQLLRADMPEEIAVVLERSLAKDPTTRFETMTAFSQAFDAAIAGKEGEETGFFSVQFDDASISDALAVDNDTITDLPMPVKPKTDPDLPKSEGASSSGRLRDEGTQPVPGERTPLATLSPEAPSHNVISAATHAGSETLPISPFAHPANRSNMLMWVVLLVALLAVGLAAFSLLSSSRNDSLQATETALQVAQTALASGQLAGSQTAQAILDAPTATYTPTPTLTFTPSQTSTSTLTPTNTPSPTPATPIAEALRDVAARSGPASTYPVVATLEADEQLDITGVSADGAWFQVRLLDGSFGWLAASSTLVTAAGDLSALPIAPPPTNTPTFTTVPPTISEKETDTQTPSNTPTDEPSSTLRQTSASTRTVVPTRTATDLPTETPTRTTEPTRTTVLTRTPTDEPTDEPTETLIPTTAPTRTTVLTRTSTNEPTNTATRTRTPSRTPSETPTRTPSPTRASTSVAASSDLTNCENALPSRLSVGDEGVVVPGEPRPVNVRENSRATARRVGVLNVGDTFEVLEGPVCNNGTWYRVSRATIEGWILEGRDEYYIEPE
ncbi:MAG: protein kinase [Burkholderiales bacterium]|nr:protein kinase [Anaerolineae bacterium]